MVTAIGVKMLFPLLPFLTIHVFSLPLPHPYHIQILLLLLLLQGLAVRAKGGPLKFLPRKDYLLYQQLAGDSTPSLGWWVSAS